MEDRIILNIDDELTLKQLVKKDAYSYFGLVNCNRIHLDQFDDNTSRKYYNLKSVHGSIVEPSENPKKLRFGIWKKEIFVGSINIQASNDSDTVMRLGYWLGSKFTGAGYVSRSVRSLLRYVFGNCDCLVVVASVNRNNNKSIKVLKKCGFIEILKGYSLKEKFYKIDHDFETSKCLSCV